MTVIAWDGKTLAADKRFVIGNAASTTVKIYKVNDFLCGFTANADAGEEMLEWFKKGSDPDKFPSCQKDKETWAPFIAISRYKFILRYERTPFPINLPSQKISIGSGADFALAAMHCGKTAKEAVEIACLYDISCGNGVDVLTHD